MRAMDVVLFLLLVVGMLVTLVVFGRKAWGPPPSARRAHQSVPMTSNVRDDAGGLHTYAFFDASHSRSSMSDSTTDMGSASFDCSSDSGSFDSGGDSGCSSD